MRIDNPFEQYAETAFAEQPETLADAPTTWKLLIVDGNEKVHQMTKLALDNFVFGGKPLEILNAYSGAEAIQKIQNDPEIKVILLDIFMEEDSSGQNLAHVIRNDLQNSLVYIIVRTRASGKNRDAPVFYAYEVDESQHQTEQTFLRLTTSLIARLRAYRDLKHVVQQKDAEKQRKRTFFVAEAAIFSQKENVVALDLSLEGCKIRRKERLNPFTHIVLRILGKDSDGNVETFTPIRATTRWCRYGNGVHHIGVAFDHEIEEKHGVFQLLDPEKYGEIQPVTITEDKQESVLGTQLTECYACGTNHILTWYPQKGTMEVKYNLFGVPVYSPLEKLNCDYNLLQVVVCPNCYFAAPGHEYFKTTPRSISPFDPQAFQPMWNQWNQEKMEAPFIPVEFFSIDRSYQQALQAYQLSIETFQKLTQAEPNNTQHPRKLIQTRLMYAEALNLRSENTEEVQAQLQESGDLMDEIFEQLSGKPKLRAAILALQIHLYFGSLEKIKKYYKYVDYLHKNAKQDPKSEFGQLIEMSYNKFHQTFKNRKIYHKDNLRNFFNN